MRSGVLSEWHIVHNILSQNYRQKLFYIHFFKKFLFFLLLRFDQYYEHIKSALKYISFHYMELFEDKKN